MKVNIKNIRTLYAKLKPEVERVTGYSLPEDGQESPFTFKLATGKLKETTSGMCKGAFKGVRSGEPVLIKAEIKISSVGEPSEESARTTLAHELVHLIEYIYFTKQSVSRQNPHGEWFLQMANKINAALGTQITAYTTDERLADRLKAAPKVRIIAVGMENSVTTGQTAGSKGKIFYFKPMGKSAENNMIERLQSSPWVGLKYAGHVVYETDNVDMKSATGRRSLSYSVLPRCLSEQKHNENVSRFSFKIAPDYSVSDEARMLLCFGV